MNGLKGLLLLAAVYLCGLFTGQPIASKPTSPSEVLASTLSATEGVVTRTSKDPINLGWLQTAKESVVLVATPFGHGSGVCYDRVGDVDFILTAKHVVEDRSGHDYEDFTVSGLRGDMDYQIHATLVRKSEYYDLAFLSVYDPANIIRISKLSDDSPIFGDLVIAMGYPSDHYPTVVTIGFAKGWVAWDAIYLNHSASIWFGNSGGPCFNQHGEVIGINVRINALNGHPNSADCGAVPIEDIHIFLRK